MTDSERNAQHAKMQAATTPEARQSLMAAHHAAMQARAKERGATLCNETRGPGRMSPGHVMGMGLKAGPPADAPPKAEN